MQRNVQVKRSDTGLGLFTTELIPRGKKIIEYTGSLISNGELNKRRGKYFFRINTKWSINGSPRSNSARYINHSCMPNAEALISGKRIWIWSMEVINAGEEITINYGKAYFDDHIKSKGCKCDACKRTGREITREKLIGYLSGKTCIDCSESDFAVLEFDHVCRIQTITISMLIADNARWERILEEIAKCDVVCANCHRRRTFKRCGSYRLRV